MSGIARSLPLTASNHPEAWPGTLSNVVYCEALCANKYNWIVELAIWSHLAHAFFTMIEVLYVALLSNSKHQWHFAGHEPRPTTINETLVSEVSFSKSIQASSDTILFFDLYLTCVAVQNNDNGDVACDSYNKARDDVELIRRLGVTHYRLVRRWD